MPHIEPAGLHDLAGAYRVCLRTGDAGRDASDTYRDPDLLGHLYVGPYLARGVGLQLVVVDGEGVAGYLLSANDTPAFEDWAERAWWPPLRERYPLRADDSPDAALIRLIHGPERTPPDLSRAYPAHLHIDLLERVRGIGLGRLLIDRLLADLRGRGVEGVHLGVDEENANGIAFYEHLGFREVEREPGGTSWACASTDPRRRLHAPPDEPQRGPGARGATPVRMRRVLAVDGGQSAIRLRHSDAAVPVELPGVSRQEGDVHAAVAGAIVDGWRLLGSLLVDRAVLGLTTAPTDTPSRERLCAAVASATGAPEVWLADDAVTAHAGALSLAWGVSVTCGTGVACLAVPRDGEPRIVGGHGYLLGDEGGAFWIGREGLRAVLRATDGRAGPTALAERAAERFGGLGDLGDRLHGADRPVDRIARFAPDVLEVVEAGDPVASAIVDAAAQELALLVRAGIRAAALGPRLEDPVPVALGGRVLAEGSLLRRRLDDRVASDVPAAAARSADGSPLDGALLLGEQDDPGRYRTLVFRWTRSGRMPITRSGS